MARIAKIDQIEGGVEAFAQAWADGANRRQLCEEFGVESVDTITNWTNRDDVKAAAGKYIRDRVLKVKRSVDAKIEQAIADLHPVDDIDALLKIRKEFAPDVPRDAEASSLELLEMAFEELDKNPELAAKLRESQQPDGVPAG